MKINKLKKLQVEYIQGLIDFSKDQKEFWQKIPYLALQCQGITGYSDQNQYAYKEGFWRIGSTTYGYQYRVDCATGNIHDWTIKNGHKPSKPHSGMLVIKIEDLDAETIYKDLLKHSKQPISSYYQKTREQLDAEHAQQALQWGVKEIYTRQ